MPANKLKYFIPAVSIVSIVAGGAAAYLYLKGAFSDASSPLASARLVPDEALMTAFISTDRKTWSQLQQFGTPEAQKLIEKGLQNFDQQLLEQANIDYEKDLTWVSSVMFAVLPSSLVQPVQATAPSQQKPPVLMVVGIKDKLSALNFANKLKADKAVSSQEFDYKGQKITQTTGKGEATYSAVLNDHLVLSSERQVVEQAIDTFKGEPSFASKDGINSVLTKGVDLKNPIAQIYMPDYAGAVQGLVEKSRYADGLPPETLARLQQVKSVVAGIGIDEAGIRMKTIAKLAPNAMQVDYQSSPGKIVTRFPGDTIALVTGSGINQYWTAFVDQTKSIPQVNLALGSTRQYLKTFNIDLDKDIFAWMDGEFALGAIPSNQGLLVAVGFGGALVFDTSDRTSAEATFSKLDAIAKSYTIGVAARNIQDKTVTEWQVPFQGALLAHGWLDRDTVFVALGGPIADAIAAQPPQSLAQSETFKAVTSSLQQPNGGYFYLNMDRALSLVTRFVAQGQVMPPETSAVLNSIHGIGITASSPDKLTSQAELLVSLKRTKS